MTPKCSDCKRDQDACICVDPEEQIKQLTAEIDRLRAALELLHNINLNNYMHDPEDYEHTGACQMAREALKGQP